MIDTRAYDVISTIMCYRKIYILSRPEASIHRHCGQTIQMYNNNEKVFIIIRST